MSTVNFVLWCRFGAELTYNGISLNIEGFGLNLYLTQLVFVSMEFLMKICADFFLEKIGRRNSIMGALFLTGLCLLINIFVSKGSSFFIAALRCLRTIWSSCLSTVNVCCLLTFCLWYLDRSYHRGILREGIFRGVVHNHVPVHDKTHSVEVCRQRLLNLSRRVSVNFTFWNFRQNGMGYTALLARLGVAISPLVMLLEDAWHMLPFVSYCAVAIGNVLVPLLLRETLNTRLPELIKDVEKPRQKGSALMECSRWLFI